MKKLTLSDEQLKKLLNLVDLNLKLNGLSVLSDTVDLYNVLMSAENVGYSVEYQPKSESTNENK